jgi:O-antigen/teichoic acid export membrane protein
MSVVFHSEISSGAAALIAAWVGLTALYDLFSDVFRGFHDYRLATLLEGLGFSALLALFLGALWMVRGSADLSGILLLAALAALGNTLVAIVLLRPRLARLTNGVAVASREILAIAWPILVTDLVLRAVSSASDIYVVGAFRTPQDAAVYGAAVRFMTLLEWPGFILAALVPPVIASMYARGQRKELEATIRATTTLASVPSILVFGGFLLLGRTVLGGLYGQFYAAGAPVLIILSVGQVFNIMAGPNAIALQMTGNHRVMMNITIVSGVLSVGGGILLVHPFGSIGVAVATCAGLIFQNVLMVIYMKRRTGIWSCATLSPVVIRSGLSWRASASST